MNSSTNNLKKKIFSFILMLSMIVSSVSFSYADTNAQANSSDESNNPVGLVFNGEQVYRGFSTYSAMMGDKYPLLYFYSDGYFKNAANVQNSYNEHLSSFAMALALSTIGNCNNAKNLMTNIGCDKTGGLGLVGSPTKDSIGAIYGVKKIFDGTKNESYLIPISVRGFGYGLEWVNNFYMGNSQGDAKGFSDSANAVLNSLTSFMSTNGIDPTKAKFLVTGYSRGGAVSNVLAARLSDKYGKEDVYGYSFEGPMAGDINDSSHDKLASYTNLHTIDNYSDFIPLLMPEYLGFDVYGDIEEFANVHDATYKSDEANMLEQLELIQENGEDYISPNTFQYKKLNSEITDIANSNLTNGLASKLLKMISEFQNNTFKIIIDDQDASNKYTQRDCMGLLFEKDGTVAGKDNRLENKAIVNRKAYISNDSVNSIIAGATIDGKTPYTIEEVAMALFGFIEGDSEALNKNITALQENFKKFPFDEFLSTDLLDLGSTIKNVEKVKAFIYYLDNGKVKYPWNSYSAMIKDLWNIVNTSDTYSGYRGLDDMVKDGSLDESFVDMIKHSIPIAIYTIAAYSSNDLGENPETLTSIIMNTDGLVMQHYPEVNNAWLRLEDSYYDNENMRTLNTTANQVETNVSNLTSLDGVTVKIKSGDTVLATIVDGKVSNSLDGRIYISSTEKSGKINELSIWTKSNENATVEIVSNNEDATTLDVARRNFRRAGRIEDAAKDMNGNSISSANVTLKKGQEIQIGSDSVIEKEIEINSDVTVDGVKDDSVKINTENKDGKTVLSIDNPDNRCITWYENDEKVGEGNVFEVQLDYSMDNVDVEARISTEHKHLSKVPAVKADCKTGTPGNIEYYKCTDCAMLFEDANATKPIALDKTVTLPQHDLKHYAETQATCALVGHAEYWLCSNCQTMFSDAEGNNEIKDKTSVVYPKPAHAYRTINVGNGCSYRHCTNCLTNDKFIAPSYVKKFKVSKGKKMFTAKWKKQSKKNQKIFSGYQLRYSVNSNMAGAKCVNIKKSASSKKIKKLVKKRRYYVQIRTYTTIRGVKYYSGWSTKSVVTK